MEERFKAGISRLYKSATWEHTVLAVSGGVDSIVMTHLYSISEIQFSIAHCNFQLRGEESMKDEEFVLALGDKIGTKVIVKRFETENYAALQGISIQMAARDLRYAWFKELATEYNAIIATAHHANDVAETLLFNFSKGTGIAGLHGISELDPLLVRPLLWAKKEELESFAHEQGIIWREDLSNESEKYMRNIIRRKVIPELERINPSFIESSLRTASRIKEAENFIIYAVEQLGIIKEEGGNVYLNKGILIKITGIEAVLYQLVKPYGFRYDQVKSIISSIDHSGAIFLTDNWVLNVDRENLIISRQKQKMVEKLIEQDDDEIVLESFKLKTKEFDAKKYNILFDNDVAALDLDKLTFPLLIRNWQQGDYFSPLGMRGKKKVSDFLIDEKIPVNTKQNILVLISENDIVWVIGYRINEYYKITPQTRRVFQVVKVSE